MLVLVKQNTLTHAHKSTMISRDS